MSYHGVLNYTLYTNVFPAVQIHCAKTRNTKTLHFTTTTYVYVCVCVAHVKIQRSQAILPTEREKKKTIPRRENSRRCFRVTSCQL